MRNAPTFSLRWPCRMILCLAVLFVFCASALAAGPFRVPFSYYADSQELSTVLTNFARTEGYSAAFTPNVSGKVSGKFNKVPPSKFLKGMQDAFDVNWYVMGRTVHFYNSSEAQRIFLTPRSGNADQLFRTLTQSGVFSPQLPGRLSGTGDVITVSGPPEYLAQIRSAVSAFEASQMDQIVMRVFPLKYAWADDQTVTSMDKTVTVPGVAAILRAMVLGGTSSSSRVVQHKATVEKLGGKGLASVGQAQSSADVPAPASPTNESYVSIMADPRVNSVIVSDAAYRMPYYEKVIKDLDKPVELVEIHAAIVDIDTDFKRDLGISYQGSYNAERGWSGGGTVTGNAVSGTGLPGAAGVMDAAGATLSTIYTHGADFFLARIQALEANNEARVLGRPSVLTVDNIQATLENTTTYYVQVEGYQAVDLYKVEAGTVLRVTPHIIREHGETSIKLAVSVQDDQDDNSGYTANSATGVPPIKQTKINTQAIVNAGQSLLIGGYYYEQKGQDESGVPLLKNIPVLGHLFKSTSKTSKRMERLILITPRIVKLNEGNVPAQVEDPSFHRAATQSHYEPRTPSARRGSGCSRTPSADAPSNREGERMM